MWPFTKSTEEEVKVDPTPVKQDSQPIFLEDVPPKFDNGSNKPPPPTFSVGNEIKSFLSNLTLEHFHISRIAAIPCFRDAGLSGFTCMFVFSSVLYVYHRNIRRAANWGFGGLMLGSIFGWEHCNTVRRQSQMAVRLAQQRFEAKNQQDNDK